MLRIITDIIHYNRNLQPVIGRIARHDRNLADQIRRSAQSVALNTMESTARVGGDARQRLRTALGEIRETRMALQLADALGYVPFVR